MLSTDSSRTMLEMQAYCDGETEVLNRFLQRHWPLANSTICKGRWWPFLQQCMDPEDVQQEFFFDAIKQWPEYVTRPNKPSKPCLSMWIVLTAKRTALRLWRHHRTEGRTPPGKRVSLDGNECVDKEVRPDSTPSQRESRQLVRMALERLSEDDRQIFDLCVSKSVRNKDVAAALGISASAAAHRLERALIRLRNALRELGLTEL